MRDAPKIEGHYWAKWRIANDGTRDAAELVPSDHWQVVQVFQNCIDPEHEDYLMVTVHGVENFQSIKNFIWGPGPLPPPTTGASVTQRERSCRSAT